MHAVPGAVIRVCALDFDGVVLESVNIKLDSFRRMFSKHQKASEIARYLEANNGVDRYTKFRHIWSKLLGHSYGPAVEKRLDKKFSGMVLEAILSCPFVPGAKEFLRDCSQPVYVISAMPLRELKIIVEARGIAARFKGLYGSPGRKADQLRDVLFAEKVAPDELLFVGDAESDRKAALEAGVQFIGRRNGEEFRGPCRVVTDLVGLPAAVREHEV